MPEHDELKELEPEQNQDLAAHTYTGQGLRAKHQSEIVHEKDSYSKDEDEQLFQVGLVNRLESEYQAEIDNLQKTKADHLAEIQDYKNELGDLYESNEAILDTFENMCRQKHSHAQQATQAKEEYTFLEGDLKRTEDILPALEKELARQKESLESVRKQLEQHSNDIETLTRSRDALHNDNGLFSKAKNWHYDRKLKKHHDALNLLTVEFAELQEKIKQYTARKTRTESEVSSISKQIEVLKEREVTAREVSTEYDRMAAEISKNFATRFTESYADGKGRGYLKAHVLNEKTKQIEQNITSKQESKDAVQHQVQNAEILDMAQKGNTQTVRAAIIDGKMYYDNTQLAKDDQSLSPHIVDSQQAGDKIVQSEEKVFLEEEKVIFQLKHLPIFQYMNSDTLMEYMAYDEHQGDFIFQNMQHPHAEEHPNEQGVSAQPPLADLIHLGLTDDVAFENHPDALPEKTSKERATDAWNALKFIWDPTAKFLGIKDMKMAAHAADTNNQSDFLRYSFYAGANTEYLRSLAASLLFFNPMKNAGLGDTFNRIGSTELFGLNLLGDANVSVASGVSTLARVAKGTARASQDFSLASRQKDYGNFVKKKGFQRFGRVMDNAATENKVSGFEGATDAATASASMALSLTGVGGLIITGSTVLMNFLIQKIGGALIRSGNNKAILNSPHVLGGLQYDKKIIKEEHFNALFAQVTGLNEPDDLIATLKVVDGIDLHRGMRRSILIPNFEIDRTMAQLGYPDPLAYRKIKLKDIHEKIGFRKDWRKALRNAIEIKGLDYNTGWTKFVKGISRNKHHYDNQKRLSRNSMAAARRKKLAH